MAFPFHSLMKYLVTALRKRSNATWILTKNSWETKEKKETIILGMTKALHYQCLYGMFHRIEINRMWLCIFHFDLTFLLRYIFSIDNPGKNNPSLVNVTQISLCFLLVKHNTLKSPFSPSSAQRFQNIGGFMIKNILQTIKQPIEFSYLLLLNEIFLHYSFSEQVAMKRNSLGTTW